MENGQLLSQNHVSAAMGCILGHAVGGSLGARYQFQSGLNALKMLEEDFSQNSRLIPILGGGRYQLESGGLTSETSMGLYLANCICENGRQYLYDKVALSYIDWLNSGPSEVGSATQNALSIPPSTNKSLSTFSYANVICQNALVNKDVLSNASMARSFPLAVLGSTLTEEEFLSFVEADTKLTHPNPLVIDACRVYANCLRTAIVTRDRIQVLNTAKRTPRTKVLLSIVENAMQRESPIIFYASETSQPECIEVDGKRMVYFGIPLHFMIFELTFGKYFERSIERIIQKGGDTDTNAAIAGSVLGALYGEEAIPLEWKNALMESVKGKQLLESIQDWINILIGNSDVTFVDQE